MIRCINLLERPTTGEVVVNGKDLTKLSAKELRKSREKIGMIFQHFNLMRSRTVFKNVTYPLKGNALNKQEIKTKVEGLLDLVGLSDKLKAYPSQLSGGQKQRVAIARALANDPQVLLCDEATSALDPETTQSILALLKEINEKLGLTIVIITHQMEVVKEICHEVAVMDKGEIVEQGDIVQIFSKPKAQMTKNFVSTIFKYDKIYELLDKNSFIGNLTEEEIIAKISFVGQNTGQAFISKVSRKFKVDASILFGNIEIIQEVPVGNLIVKFNGGRDSIVEAFKYLEDKNVEVEVIRDASVLSESYA